MSHVELAIGAVEKYNDIPFSKLCLNFVYCNTEAILPSEPDFPWAAQPILITFWFETVTSGIQTTI